MRSVARLPIWAASRPCSASRKAGAKLPGPAAASPAISAATPATTRAVAAAVETVALDGRKGRDQRRHRAAHGSDTRHERMPVVDRDEALAVAHPIHRTGQGDRSAQLRCVLGDARRRRFSRGEGGELRRVAAQDARRAGKAQTRKLEARRRGVDEDWVEHPGLPVRLRGCDAPGDRRPPVVVERAEIDEERVGPRREGGDLVRRDRERRRAADREQQVRGQHLRGGVGDGVDARAPFAQPREQLRGLVGPIDRGASGQGRRGRCHLAIPPPA